MCISHPSAALFFWECQDNTAQCLPDALRVRIELNPVLEGTQGCRNRDTFLSLSESLQRQLLPDCPVVLMKTMFERENKRSQLSLKGSNTQRLENQLEWSGITLEKQNLPQPGPLCGEAVPGGCRKLLVSVTPNPLQALLNCPCALGRKLEPCCCNYKPILNCWMVE